MAYKVTVLALLFVLVVAAHAVSIKKLRQHPEQQEEATYAGYIFLTQNTYSLNLGGIAGADAFCTLEAGEPAKALLVDENGCDGSPCRRASVTQFLGDGQIDWPLMPNAVYYEDKDRRVAMGNTGMNSLFVFPLARNSLPCTNHASGMRSDWTTIPGGTCDSWTTQNGSAHNQAVGWSCSTSNGLMYGGALDWPCTANKLLCVSVPSLDDEGFSGNSDEPQLVIECPVITITTSQLFEPTSAAIGSGVTLLIVGVVWAICSTCKRRRNRNEQNLVTSIQIAEEQMVVPQVHFYPMPLHAQVVPQV